MCSGRPAFLSAAFSAVRTPATTWASIRVVASAMIASFRPLTLIPWASATCARDLSCSSRSSCSSVIPMVSAATSRAAYRAS